MMRWLFPLFIGALAAAGAYHVTLVATPYVLMQGAMKKIGNASGKINAFAFGKPATSENQPVVRPSPDLSYSSCTFDLSEGPVLIDVAPVPNHYWSVSIFDARTDVAAVRSDRDIAGRSVRLALVRPGQRPPVGYDKVELEHDKGIALLRILVNDKAEYPVIDAMRRKSTCKRAVSR